MPMQCHADGIHGRRNEIWRQRYTVERQSAEGSASGCAYPIHQEAGDIGVLSPAVKSRSVGAVSGPGEPGLDPFDDLMPPEVVRLVSGEARIALRVVELLDGAGVGLRVRQGAAGLRWPDSAADDDPVATEIKIGGLTPFQRR